MTAIVINTLMEGALPAVRADPSASGAPDNAAVAQLTVGTHPTPRATPLPTGDG
jgi:hypothetical protein